MGDNSVVVRGAVNHELYVLPLSKFEANWEPEGVALGSTPQEIFEAEQGFKLYQPKASSTRWIYRITEKDMEKIPNGRFESAWAEYQTVKPGDHLALLDAVGAPEIYLMPEDILA